MTVKKESSAEKVVTITDNNVIIEPDSDLTDLTSEQKKIQQLEQEIGKLKARKKKAEKRYDANRPSNPIRQS